MRYEDMLHRIPERTIPDWWVATLTRLDSLLQHVTRGEVRILTMTPGSRPMHLVSYGLRETYSFDANYSSALGAGNACFYIDRSTRQLPVVLFVGPVHGHETEGMVGLANLIAVMEEGRDLSGCERPRLRQLGESCRLLIIPAGNPDGIARFAPQSLQGMQQLDVRFWGQGTWNDGTLCDYPACKQLHPMRGSRVGFPGCYFDDVGVNPWHDDFFAPMGPEAPAILDVARTEGPDVAVLLHSHESAAAILRPSHVPQVVLEQARGLAEAFYLKLAARGHAHGRLFDCSPEIGPRLSPFSLLSALHHSCGAVACTFECPHGLDSDEFCRASFEEILDIQMCFYEAALGFALASSEET